MKQNIVEGELAVRLNQSAQSYWRGWSPLMNKRAMVRRSIPIFAMVIGCALPLSRPDLIRAGTESPVIDTTIRIDSGSISGIVVDEKSRIRAYQGIPYATPPVGSLRWRPPKPPESWSGVRGCTEFGPACPQPAGLFQVPTKQSEDCLYLNVWTSWRSGGAPHPVMVWIHGGGFTTGAGSMTVYDGKELARHGAVVVTINYRLGPFGFLAHPLLSNESEHNVSGNYGFLDQIEALKWVKRNIAAFGGNPECVTIFGESAGAASVSRLMISPLAQGLFHRAIAQSGGPLGRNRHLRKTWYGLESMEEIGERIERDLGLRNSPDRLAALRSVTPAKLLEVSKPMPGLFGKGIKFGPVVDGYVIPDDPTDLWEAGKQADVPFMTGSNADEGTIFLPRLPVKRPWGYALFVRAMFPEHAREVLEMFPAKTTQEVQPALNRLLTVSAFVQPARFMARAMEGRSSKCFLYHFTRRAQGERLGKLGAFHSYEIPFVFQSWSENVPLQEVDRSLAEAMSTAWIRFAATGDPNAAGLVAWPPYLSGADQHLILGDRILQGSHLYRKECDLFDRVVRDRRDKRDEDYVAEHLTTGQ